MLTKDGRLLIAKNDTTELSILPNMLNRHGLITGATGTGKTVSLQVLAESISSLGVPVLITDIKGDVSGISTAGTENPKIKERVDAMRLADAGYAFRGSPVCFWDIFGEKGHPLRATISEMGPLLISRVLDLNDTQTGVLQILFRIADDGGLLLLDLKDLRKLVEFVSQKENRAQFMQSYGNIAPASLGAIQRGLLTLEEQGGDVFFGEPALQLHDFLRTGEGGKGVVNILAADKLMQSPRVYAAFLLWLLSEFYENLPEVGDLPKPKIVLFFDEAHLLFSDAPKILLERIEQVVRLVRSKGVGIYFITQNPADIPETVLAQLGNRVQHALRAYTPKEQKAVRAAAGSFRPNPAFKTEDAITELGVGEALVSTLDEKGAPRVVERAPMLPPESRIGAISPEDREMIVKQSLLFGRYETVTDRESAYELLTARVLQQLEEAEATIRAEAEAKAAKTRKKDSVAGGLLGDFMKKTQQSVTRNIANQVGRSLIRGILGSLFGKR
jgi:DNA helicase HerA-like ATPase